MPSLDKQNNIPLQGKHVSVSVFSANDSSWSNFAQFQRANLDFQINSTQYTPFGFSRPIDIPTNSFTTISFERGHVNPEILLEFHRTYTIPNDCSVSRPEYTIQISMCYSGLDTSLNGWWILQFKETIFKGMQLSLQGGDAENTETLNMEGYSYLIQPTSSPFTSE